MPNDRDTVVTVLERIARKLEGPVRHSFPASDPLEKCVAKESASEFAAPVPPAQSPSASVASSPAGPVPIPNAPIAATPIVAKDVLVYGSNLHYIEAGSATAPPVLFIHGNPTSSHLWRNIIPALSGRARCIALDLIGMGKSDKPKIDYRLLDHYRYLEGFIDQLGLQNITLVLHDWGSALGFHYMRMHPGNVKAVAFLEALLKPYPSWEAFPRAGAPPQFAQAFSSYRGEPGRGALIDDDTRFINQLLLPVMGVDLSQADLDQYWEPFVNKEDREPVWRWPNELPVANDPADVAALVDDYSRALRESPTPKLLIYHHNGVIVAEPEAEWCRSNLKNFEYVEITKPLAGPVHFLQECFPNEVGQALARWFQTL